MNAERALHIAASLISVIGFLIALLGFGLESEISFSLPYRAEGFLVPRVLAIGLIVYAVLWISGKIRIKLMPKDDLSLHYLIVILASNIFTYWICITIVQIFILGPFEGVLDNRGFFAVDDKYLVGFSIWGLLILIVGILVSLSAHIEKSVANRSQSKDDGIIQILAVFHSAMIAITFWIIFYDQTGAVFF